MYLDKLVSQHRSPRTPSLVYSKPLYGCVLKFNGHYQYLIRQRQLNFLWAWLPDTSATRHVGTGAEVS